MSTGLITIQLKKLRPDLSIVLPQQMSGHAAGYDLSAALDAPVTLEPGGRRLIPCGFAMAVPSGYEAQVRPRSGLAHRHGIGLLNSPGTIDADYRGEVKVLMINWGQDPFVIEHGLRVAQLVFARVEPAQWVEVGELDQTDRGVGGFGSTGP